MVSTFVFVAILLSLIAGPAFGKEGNLKGGLQQLQFDTTNPIDPIIQQVNDEVAKVVKITSGLKRIGSGPGMPGGWGSADIKSKEVLAIANWASEKLYPGLHPSPRVTQAMTQVVAGLNYNITMSVTRLVKAGTSSTTCSVENVAVWDRFGTNNLMKNVTVSSRC